MSELADKERRAIKILRMYRGDDPIEVSYSGGKDSDVILALTKMAGIPYRAIYNGYQYFAAHIFDSLETFEAVTHASLFGKEDWKQRLEDFFKIEL